MANYKISIGLKMMLERAKSDPVAAYNAAAMIEAEHRGQLVVQSLYLRSANGGYVPAMLRVAGYYITGQYIVDADDDLDQRYICDIAEGVSWIKRAVEKDDHVANYMLARCYADGIGVEQNLIKASYFLNHARFHGELNPYEPIEALLFGSLSDNLQDCIRRNLRQKSLLRAN